MFITENEIIRSSWRQIDTLSGFVKKMCWTRLKSCILVGAPKVVGTRLLDLLSPIAHHHSVAFLSAIGITWQEKRSPGTHGLVKNPLPVCNEDQQVII